MLPTTTVNGGKRGEAQRSGLPLYLRRIIRPKQMDFECGPCPALLSARVLSAGCCKQSVLCHVVHSTGL